MKPRTLFTLCFWAFVAALILVTGCAQLRKRAYQLTHESALGAPLALFKATPLAEEEEEGEREGKRADDPEKAWEWFVRRRLGPQGLVPIDYREKALAESALLCKPKAQDVTAFWTQIAPTGAVQPSGRIIDLAVHPNGQTIYAASASGGVWKTTDQGLNWTNCTDAAFPSLGCGSIIMDPNNSEVLYVGLGEGMTGTGAGVEPLGTGIYKTTDGGNTWALCPGTGAGTMQFVVDIRFLGNSNTMLAAATGGSKNAGAGLFKSTNAGASWTMKLGSPVPIWSISVDPTNANNVVITSRENDDQGFYCGIYYSTDGFENFQAATIPNNRQIDADVGSSYRIELSRCDQSPNTMYALVGSTNSRIHGIWKSTDGGHTWNTTAMTGVPPKSDQNLWPGQMTYNNCITVDPKDPNHVFFGCNLRGYKSADGAGNWAAYSDWAAEDLLPYIHADHHVIAVDKTNSNIVYMGTDGGFFMSTDGGTTWQERNNGIVCTQIYRLGGHPANENALIYGCQDNDKYIRKPDGSWHHYPNSFGDGMEMECYPLDAQNDAYLGTGYFGNNMQFTPDGGPSWYPLRLITQWHGSNNGIPDDEQGGWVAPLMLDPQHPINVWTCLRDVYRREYDDQFVKNWTKIVDLPDVQGIHQWEYMDLSSGASTRQLYVGYFRINMAQQYISGIYRADIGDGTGTASNLTEVAIPRYGYLGAVKCHPTENDTIWIGYSDFYFAPGDNTRIHKSTNKGQTWVDKTSNFPKWLPVMAIFIDPDHPQTVIVGTDLGCYRSDDDGTTWYEFNGGMPNTVVTDFAYYAPARKLRAATYGRGLWETNLDGSAGEPDISVSPEKLTFTKVPGAPPMVEVSGPFANLPSPPAIQPPANAPRLLALASAAPRMSAMPIAAAPASKAAAPGIDSITTTTILNEDFEGGFPGTRWTVWRDASTWDIMWGLDDHYYHHGGSKSVWCAAGGTYGLDPEYNWCPDGIDTFMLYGPFSLADATAARMTFWTWMDIIEDYDYARLHVLLDTSGTLMGTYEATGYSGGWVQVTADFSSVPTLGNILGRPQVWIVFETFRNIDWIGYNMEGVWLDDIVIEKATGAATVDPPTGVAATNNLSDRITVTWNASAGATEYQVWYTAGSDNPGTAAPLSGWITALTYDHMSPMPGVTYYYYVKAKNASSTSGLSSPGAPGSLAAAGLPAPTGVTATTNLTDRVTITWNSVTGALQYQVWRNTGTDNHLTATQLSGWISGLTYDDTTAVESTTYYYYVMAKNDTTYSELSAGARGVRVAVPPLDAPTGVAATSNLTDRVTVTWNAVTDATEYRVYRNAGSDNAGQATELSAWIAPLTYDDTTAQMGTTYYYYVKAHNATQNSPLSSGAAGAKRIPTTLASQTFTISNPGKATLNVTGITVQNGAAWVLVLPPESYPVSIAPSGSAKFTVYALDEGMAAGTYTDHLLIANNTAGKNPYPTGVDIVFNNGVTVEPPDTPASPAPVSGASGVSRAVVLDWADAARAEKYDLYLWKDGQSKPGTPTAADLTASQYDPPGDLDYATLYHWQVTAKNTSGNTAGPEWTFTTMNAPVEPPDSPASPSPASGATGVSRAVVLDWADAARAEAYDLYLWKDGQSKPGSPTAADLTASQYDPPGDLDYSTLYRWQVTAKNTSGNTAGPEWTFTTMDAPVTPPDPPSSPNIPSGATGVSRAIALDWADAARAEAYDLYLWKDGQSKPGTPTAADLTASQYDPPGDLDYSTLYHWQVTAKNTSGNTAGPEWTFTTMDAPVTPPDAPATPTPASGGTGVSRAVVLDWADAARAEKYDLYLWKEGQSKPGTPTAGDLAASQYDPPADLDASTLYHWQVTAKNASGNTAGPEWTFTTQAASNALLYNISTRGLVGNANDAMFAGFIITGSASKTVAVTGWGPRLADFGVTNVLADPTLTVYQGSNALETCDNWKSSPYKDLLESLNLAPKYDQESGVVLTLGPGEYTAILGGVGNTGLTNGIVAVWDCDTANSKLTNISTRGWVGTGDSQMFAGFIIQGASKKTVAITGWGPRLGDFGVTNYLANPTLTVYQGSTTLGTCDDWQTSPYASDLNKYNLAPKYPAESGVVLTLDPGEYTAILSGVGGATGNAIVAVWAVQ